MLIDANIFLEILLDQKKSEKCKNFLRKIQTNQKQAFISSFTIDTIILSMYRNKTPVTKIKIFLQSLRNFQGLKFYNITFRDRILALDLIKKHGLDYEDAITLQSAFSNDCKQILSFDKHFNKVKKIERVEP